MPTYKHTQIEYLMIVVTLTVLALFVWMQVTARAEPPSVNSGTNFLFTAIMALIVLLLASFTTLTVSIDAEHLSIKFSHIFFAKKFAKVFIGLILITFIINLLSSDKIAWAGLPVILFPVFLL